MPKTQIAELSPVDLDAAKAMYQRSCEGRALRPRDVARLAKFVVEALEGVKAPPKKSKSWSKKKETAE